VVKAVVADLERGTAALGAVIGGSGNGEQIAANKAAGVPAALTWDESTAQLAREYDDANFAALGARQHDIVECLKLVDEFIGIPFSGDERHFRCIAQIAAFEDSQ
jgi:ribose 5-phosphate isomerase B